VEGKGSHRNYIHPDISRLIMISGKDADDARHYQIRAIRIAMQELKK